MKKTRAVEAVVFGIVQGVGFRPFIYRTARQLGYRGWVKNIGFGVEIHLEADRDSDFSDFLDALNNQHPPLAQIEHIDIKEAVDTGSDSFTIQSSRESSGFVFISPDISVCANCLEEMRNPDDRRRFYPFINCTDCGPRYTIVRELPYDRDKTTMDLFEMCPDCRREYTNPMDRRYHAQPIACPACGPRVSLLKSSSRSPVEGGLEKAAGLLKAGRIVAIKGLGGFHLVCDPRQKEAVRRLRLLKDRQFKPLALMAKNRSVVEKYALLNPDENRFLHSARRPIVLLEKKREIPGIAPGLGEYGFMLPYTPLHDLLLDQIDLIVATSSNPKDSPIMKDENEGVDAFCDYILTHNRPIHMRADDSLMKVVGPEPLFLRRARGYVPYPQAVPEQIQKDIQILALGGELKDTVSIYKNGYIVTSQFLGDLDEYQNYQYFEETIAHLCRLFDVKPQIVVSDLHPNFHTTRYAQKLNLPHVQVQHHYAHTLAPLLEHGIVPEKKVLGVSWDGFGYGDDGTAWGAEFLLADYSGYSRYAHFRPVPLAGGDLAAKQPWRMALAYMLDAYSPDLPPVRAFSQISPAKINGVKEMIKRGLNCPPASSCGRLFDAISFLTGLAPSEVEFEAQAPMLLECAARHPTKKSYPFEIAENHEISSRSPLEISFIPMIHELIKDLHNMRPAASISAKFHNTLSEVIVAVAEHARKSEDIETVVVSGGVFLNRILLQAAKNKLENRGFRFVRPILYSPNDESISIGQIAYVLKKFAPLT